MANSTSTSTDLNSDYILLKEILENFKKFVEEFLISNSSSSDMKPTVSAMIPGRYHEEIIKSWNEISPQIISLVETIQGNNINHENLKSAGLSGNQLRLKHKFCIEAYDRSRDWITEEKQDEKPKDKPWYKRWWSHCRRFLDGSGIVIKSLSKAIPYAETISEFIDGVIYLGNWGTHSSE